MKGRGTTRQAPEKKLLLYYLTQQKIKRLRMICLGGTHRKKVCLPKTFQSQGKEITDTHLLLYSEQCSLFETHISS